MAPGEYVSVSTQRDSEQALLAKERRELRETQTREAAAAVPRDLSRPWEAPQLGREVALARLRQRVRSGGGEVEPLAVFRAGRPRTEPVRSARLPVGG